MAETVLAKMAVEISANAAKFNTAINQAQGQFKGLTSAVGTANKLLAGFGIGFSALAVVGGLRSVLSIMSEFEATMSAVRAITGATGEEFKALERDALRLGAATKFTSNEVGELQIAYGRLGFNTKEILAATEATLDLAAATGEDLAKSADVAGSTVRGFGLKAKETQRVVDVMAKSFNTTALSLENFTESMKYVAPVAAAAGLSVEETTALLGTLADAGIRGSMAGTSLRKILTDLPKDARPFQERLAELAAKGITVADAMDEVGRTAQTSLLILAKNNEKTIQLTKSFSDVAGEAARVARIMQDNLQGDVEKLTSAFEGLILSLSNSSIFREFTQGLTEFVNVVQGSGASLDRVFKEIAHVLTKSGDLNNFSDSDIAANLDQYVQRLKEIRQEAGKPFDLKIVEELAEKYNLTSRGAAALRTAIEESNKALSFQETAIKRLKDFAARNGYTDLTLAVDDYIDSLNKLIVTETNRQQGFKQSGIDLNTDAFKVAQNQSDETIQGYLRTINVLRQFKDENGEVVKSTTAVAAANATVANSLKGYKDALKLLNDEFDKTSADDLPKLRNLSANISEVELLIGRLERLKTIGDIQLVIKVPDLKGLLDPITKVTKTEGGVTFDLYLSLSDAMVERFEARLAKTRKSFKEFSTGIKEDFQGIDLRGLIANSVDGIGEALGSAIAGTQSLGKALLGVFGGVLQQFGKMLIAAGVGLIGIKKAFQSLNGYVAIAAGVALVALGAAVSGSIKGLGKGIGTGGGGSGSSGGSSTSNFTRESAGDQVILIGGEIRFNGTSLVLALDKANKSRERTG